MTVGYSALPNNKTKNNLHPGPLNVCIDECSAAPSLVCDCPLVAQYGDWQWIHFFESFLILLPRCIHCCPSSPVSLILTGVCRLSISLVSLSKGSMAELRVSEVETNLHTILVAPPVIRARAQKPDQIVMWVLTDALSRQLPRASPIPQCNCSPKNPIFVPPTPPIINFCLFRAKRVGMSGGSGGHV